MFARQLDHLLGRYRPISAAELLARKPLVSASALFTFDDGLANHASVVAPLLEERGLRGVFSVPTDFPSVALLDQPAWFRRHVRTRRDAEHLEDEDMQAMTWDQVRDLVNRGHTVASHTCSHLWINPATPPDVLQHELVDSRDQLESVLGTDVTGFCWPVTRDPAARNADQLVRKTYEFALVGDSRPLREAHDLFRIARTNVEASWPLEALDLQLSGIVDAKLALVRMRSALLSR